MKLKTYLHQVDEKRIKDLTAHHGIYYNPEFSRSWISSQIVSKLANQTYLKKLIQQQLNQSSKKLLEKLLATGSINKQSINLNSYYILKDYGLIYDRNDFCYLFPQLKPLLKEILVDTKPQNNNSTAKKFKLKSKQTTEKSTCNLSFFHYLVLTMAYIKQNYGEPSLTQKHLASFMQQTNLTKLSSKNLLQKLLQYSYKQNLITKDLTITSEFQSWLQTSQQEKILSAINTFFPQSKSALRKIIAVLSHYPLDKKIPLDFAQQELHLETIDQSQQQLLGLLNIIKIKQKQITLVKESWQHFNPQVKFKYANPKTEKQKIMVPPTTKLKQLWEVAKKNQLLAINEQLVFKNLNS